MKIQISANTRNFSSLCFSLKISRTRDEVHLYSNPAPASEFRHEKEGNKKQPPDRTKGLEQNNKGVLTEHKSPVTNSGMRGDKERNKVAENSMR